MIDLSDIHAVRIECAACGASVSLNTTKWNYMPRECPACQVNWNIGTPTPQAINAQQFGPSLKNLIAALPQSGSFKVRLEIGKPKN